MTVEWQQMSFAKAVSKYGLLPHKLATGYVLPCLTYQNLMHAHNSQAVQHIMLDD